MTPADIDTASEAKAYLSSRSLREYLGHVTIDSEPHPMAWGAIIEPWQVELVKPIIPAIESMAGIRTDYTGPTNFWFELPKGHDKTGLIGRIVNWATGFSQNRITGAAAASTREQASLLLKSATAESGLNPWIPVEPFRNEIRGPGGSITVLSSEAGASSGRKDDLVILDELTFWPSRDLWDILYAGSFKRERQVFIVITNAGMLGTWQHELREMARTDDAWHFHSSPHGRMLASWMTAEKVAKVREGLAPGFARRVIDNEWIDATEHPLIPRELIEQRIGECLWTPEHFRDKSYRPQLYMGVDFGRTHNRTVIWTWEEIDGQYLTREVSELHDVPFAKQESIIREKLTRTWGGGRPRVLKCKLDKGAQGWTTTENLERDFPGVCEGEHLTGGFRGNIATELKAGFEKGTVTVPDDAAMVADLQRVGQVETANGKPKLKVDESADGLHADYFWAAALGLACIPNKRRVKSRSVAKGQASRHLPTSRARSGFTGGR